MLLGDLFAAKSRKISGIETRVSAKLATRIGHHGRDPRVSAVRGRSLYSAGSRHPCGHQVRGER